MLKDLATRDTAALFISTIILGCFAYFEWWALNHTSPAVPDQLLLGLMTALTNLAFVVAGYWIGSSKGSQAKDATIGQMAINTQEALHATPLPPKPPGPPVAGILIAALIALALLAQGQPANAAELPRRPPVATKRNCIPYPQCLGGLPDSSGGDTPSPARPGDPISAITQFTVGDLTKAIEIASKPPALTAEIACFGLIRDGLAALADNADTKGDGLATLYVKLVRINTLKKAIVDSSDCLAVCGRAESMVPVGIFTHIPIGIVPTMCSVIKAVTP